MIYIVLFLVVIFASITFISALLLFISVSGDKKLLEVKKDQTYIDTINSIYKIEKEEI